MEHSEQILICQVIDNLEDTIKKGGEPKCIETLKKRVSVLRKLLILT